MRILREWVHRLWGTLNPRRRDNDIEEELRLHVEMAAENAQRRGTDTRDAIRAARIRTGGTSQAMDALRDQRGLPWVEDFVRDVRHGLRSLRRSPVFTAVALLTLALGIGANAAIFSVMDSLLVRRLPVDNPDELVLLRAHRPEQAEPGDAFTNPLWEAVRDRQDVFAGVFAWSSPQQFDFSPGAAVQNVDGFMVSGRYFDTLRVAPAAGRLIADVDDRRGCPAVAVLSYGFWQTQFGGSGDAVGRTIALFRQPFQVIGVAARGFHGLEVGRKFDVALPVCASALFDARNVESRGRWWLSIAGRLKPGMTDDQLKSRLDVLGPAVMSAAVLNAGADNRQRFLQTRLVTASLATGSSGLRRTFGEPLKMLMAGVAIVLLIACANIAGLLLAKATTRAKEIAIRTALGASRRRLMRQLLTESLLLSSLGAALGLLLAFWGSDLLVRSLATAGNPVFVEVSPGARVLGFTAGIAVVTGMLIGLLPAIRATSVSLIAAMKSRQAAAGAREARFRAGKWIVGAQVALSLVLLIGGGLLLRTFVKLVTLDTGFDRHNVLVVTAKAPWFAADTVTTTPEQRAAAYDEIGHRLREIPGVLSVARSYMTPIGDDNWFNTISTDAPNAPTGEEAAVYLNLTSPEYFETLRTPLVSGRGFDRRDTKSSPPVAIVNESAARKFFAGANSLGRRFRMGGQPARLEVVGIVTDSKYQSLREAMPPTIYLPAAQAPAGGEADSFIVRTATAPSPLIPVIERTMRGVAGEVPLRFQTLADQVAGDLVQDRLLAILAGCFGAMALLLATIGLYGVLSYLVTHRQVEFGIRMALGAEPASIRRLVMRDVGIVLVAGLAAGLAAALASVRLLQGMLFEIEPRDPVTMVAAVCLLSAMALLAGYLPARRATRVDPIVALRAE
jgi:predicted permease